MKYLSIILLCLLASCSRPANGPQPLSEAERLAKTAPDSALAVLRTIEPGNLHDDDAKALYYLVEAMAHKAKESPMASDSLIRFSFDYYRDKDYDRHLRSGDLYAIHRFWVGDGKGALNLLDSLISLPDVSDTVAIELLQSRIGIGGTEFDCQRNITYIRRLQELDPDSANQIEYAYQLCENYQFIDRPDSALIIIDQLVDYAKKNHLGEDQFKYTYEKGGILEELGRYEESNATFDYLFEYAPDNTAKPFLRFWKAMNYFNMGDFDNASRQLAIGDSCILAHGTDEAIYYESFASPLREFLKYRRNGIITLSQLATVNNSQRNRYTRMESTRWEAEQNALRQENRALTLKAQNDRKTAIIIIVALTAIIIALAAIWNAQKRKHKAIEAEERAEALQKMVDEMTASAPPSTKHEALRRAMLQQLGIIKMVAETPTEQNREMLRKISSIDSDTNGALVNWQNVYEIIDNLYSGFYSRLHQRHGDVLTDKEEQIIALMMAGFSTKEIGVITAQTTATIYVRKSSARKKLGVPEKEDIVAFLLNEPLA